MTIRDTWLTKGRRFFRNAAGRALRTIGLMHPATYWSANGDLRQAISAVDKQHSAEATADVSPVFVLSAGWRSGSTWIQRRLLKEGIMIWGEPYDLSSLIQSLSSQLRPFATGWPPKGYYFESKTGLSADTDWLANLYPSIADLRAAHRAYFERLFDAPAREHGYTRWGVKEVRLTGEHALYLKWIYPNAKFIFLVRKPCDAFASYRETHKGWYFSWPNDRVWSAWSFGRRWRLLVRSFLEYQDELHARIILYEDLVRGDVDLGELSDYLGLSGHLQAVKVARGAMGRPSKLNPLVRFLIWSSTESLEKQLSRL